MQRHTQSIKNNQVLNLKANKKQARIKSQAKGRISTQKLARTIQNQTKCRIKMMQTEKTNYETTREYQTLISDNRSRVKPT
tara:strand:- start:3773 stop:4015 length:243 start_codon:yes stop_codon:yes gene_type:complete